MRNVWPRRDSLKVSAQVETQGRKRVIAVVGAYVCILVGLPVLLGLNWWVFALVSALLPVVRHVLLRCDHCGAYRIGGHRTAALDGPCTRCGKN
jgi:hypothetical protein